jgi:hypothetical protein
MGGKGDIRPHQFNLTLLKVMSFKSFNARLGQKRLNAQWLLSLGDAKRKIHKVVISLY